MTEAGTTDLGLLAKLVIALAIGLIIAELLWHGVTTETVERLWRNLVQRPSGPVSFRFVLQPAMATVAAIKDGFVDARTGRSPYFLTVMSNPRQRIPRLREGLEATARIILLGIVMDIIYQFLVLDTFYPLEALIVALLLAFLPYFILRGPISRIVRKWRGRATAHHV
jgi:hypothetical protein